MIDLIINHWFITYLIGGVVFFLLHGIIEGKLFHEMTGDQKGALIASSIFWFVVLPILTLFVLRSFMVKINKNVSKYKQNKKKIRIAKIKETSELFEVAEKEAEEILNKKVSLR